MTTYPRTIQRRWKTRVETVRTTATAARSYNRDNGEMETSTVDDALSAWQDRGKAKLTEDVPGQKWTVHLPGGGFYILVAAETEPVKVPEPVKAEEPREERRAPTGARAMFPAGFDAATQEAAAATTDRHRAAGADMVSGPKAAAHVARVVKGMRCEGMSHADIRAQFEKERAQAADRGDVDGVAAAETFLSAHAGMVADLAALSAPGRARTAPLTAPEPVCWCGESPCPMPGQHANTQGACDAMNANMARIAVPTGAPVAPGEPEDTAELPPALPPKAGPRVLPPHEEGYRPFRGAKPYPVRRALEALEAAGVPVKGDGVEFWLTVTQVDDITVNVSVLDVGDSSGARGPGVPGRKDDRRELRRCEVVAALLRGGLTDAVRTRGGVRLTVARPAPRARTLVVLGQADYSHDRHIEWPVTLPQYPELTGWTMRKPWGHNYMGPMDPWMQHADGTTVGHRSKDEGQAARALCHLYGLLEPVRVTTEV